MKGIMVGRLEVIVLALLAALRAAVGIVLRQRATSAVPANRGPSGTLVAAVMKNPSWWAGTGVAVAGYVCQALALSRGSLLLVQRLLVSSLLLALPLTARLTHRCVTTRGWAWAVLLTVGLAVFVVVGQPCEGHNRPPVPAWALVAAVFMPVVVICVVAAGRVSGRRRAVLLAVAVAILFATVAVLTKISTYRLAGGLTALLVVPAPYLLVVVAVSATVLQQSAFHAGALQPRCPRCWSVSGDRGAAGCGCAGGAFRHHGAELFCCCRWPSQRWWPQRLRWPAVLSRDRVGEVRRSIVRKASTARAPARTNGG